MNVEHEVRLYRTDQMDIWIYIEQKQENVDLGELLGLEAVSMVIKKCRLRWLGHGECKEYAEWVKQCMMKTDGTVHCTGEIQNLTGLCRVGYGMFW